MELGPPFTYALPATPAAGLTIVAVQFVLNGQVPTPPQRLTRAMQQSAELLTRPAH